MNAFFDASCRKCGAHIGWNGDPRAMPNCHKCGAAPDQRAVESDAKAIEDFRELMAERPLSATHPRLRKMRLASGLTLRKAAELLGLTGTDLTSIENGERPLTPELSSKMVDVYGMNP